jgi:hypothetical protein
VALTTKQQGTRVVSTPNVDGVPALPRVPSARCSQRACAFAAVQDGLCRGHLRDRQSEYSGMGTCAAQLLGFAPVAEQANFRVVDKKSYPRRPCRKYRTPEEIQARQRAYYWEHKGLAVKVQSKLCVQCGHEFQTRSNRVKFRTSQCRDVHCQRNHPPRVAKKSNPSRSCRSTRQRKCRTLDQPKRKAETLPVLSPMEILAKLGAHFSNPTPLGNVGSGLL